MAEKEQLSRGDLIFLKSDLGKKPMVVAGFSKEPIDLNRVKEPLTLEHLSNINKLKHTQEDGCDFVACTEDSQTFSVSYHKDFIEKVPPKGEDGTRSWGLGG